MHCEPGREQGEDGIAQWTWPRTRWGWYCSVNQAKSKVMMVLLSEPGQEQGEDCIAQWTWPRTRWGCYCSLIQARNRWGWCCSLNAQWTRPRTMWGWYCSVNLVKNKIRMVCTMYVLFSELGQEHCEDGIAQVTGDPLPNLRNSNLFVIHITVSWYCTYVQYSSFIKEQGQFLYVLV